MQLDSPTQSHRKRVSESVACATGLITRNESHGEQVSDSTACATGPVPRKESQGMRFTEQLEQLAPLPIEVEADIVKKEKKSYSLGGK